MGNQYFFQILFITLIFILWAPPLFNTLNIRTILQVAKFKVKKKPRQNARAKKGNKRINNDNNGATPFLINTYFWLYRQCISCYFLLHFVLPHYITLVT